MNVCSLPAAVPTSISELPLHAKTRTVVPTVERPTTSPLGVT
jgi:hypothetical protein